MNKTIEEKMNEYIKDIDSLGYGKIILLNTHQVSKILGVSDGTIEKMRREGIGIDYKQFGKRIMYAKRDVAYYLANNRVLTA